MALQSVPSGRQVEIRHGAMRATVVEVGGGLREFAVGDRPVLDPFPLDAMSDGGHGQVLLPWPNRVADGRYRFDGVEHQLDLSEPGRHNAIHGLVRWRTWRAEVEAADRVVMGMRLHPTPGYPFTLDVRAAYALGSDGLTATLEATNAGDTDCPFACGQHLYLSPGAGTIDACLLSFEAERRIVCDATRQLPAGRESAARGPFDFRSGRTIGDQAIDCAFEGLSRDGAGRAWLRLRGHDGRWAELWQDEAFPLVQIYTGDSLAPHRRRQGLAAEPMSAPPNALQSGEGLARLRPGDRFVARWGLRLGEGAPGRGVP